MHHLIKKITSQASLSEQQAWWLLEKISGKKRGQLILESTLSPEQLQTLDQALIKLTKDHMPLDYLLGQTTFLNLTLALEPPILIPRPETELWVHEVVQMCTPHASSIKRILDIGTGSGCIALALAQAFPEAQVVAIDINEQALQLATKNAQINNITSAAFVASNLFENLQNQTFDLIVSNPPYIDPAMQQTLQKNVLDWEDHRALFAQNHGTEIIERILQGAQQFLTKNPDMPYQLIMEIDEFHKDLVQNLTKKYGWDSAEFKKDEQGKWRTLWCKV